MDGQGGLSDQDNVATMAKRRALRPGLLLWILGTCLVVFLGLLFALLGT